MVNIKLENQFLDSEMSIKKSIVILAGGLGSRYNGLKQIDGILENNDSPILEYSIYDGIKAGFKKFVFIYFIFIIKCLFQKLFHTIVLSHVFQNMSGIIIG